MNTIYLLHGEAILTRDEFKRFNEGDTIWGNDSNPERIKTFKEDGYTDEYWAKKELLKYSCSYKEDGVLIHINEYALEYCNTDDVGEFINGSDYNLASKWEWLLSEVEDGNADDAIREINAEWIYTDGDETIVLTHSIHDGFDWNPAYYNIKDTYVYTFIPDGSWKDTGYAELDSDLKGRISDDLYGKVMESGCRYIQDLDDACDEDDEKIFTESEIEDITDTLREIFIEGEGANIEWLRELIIRDLEEKVKKNRL